MLLLIIGLLLTGMVYRTCIATIWHLDDCRGISHGLLCCFFINSRLTRINLWSKGIRTPFERRLHCRLTLLLKRNIVVAAGAVAVPRNAILTAGEALTVKFQALRVPTVATFARTLVHVHRRSRLTNIGDLTVLSRIWNHLVLGVYDLPVF